MPAIHDDEIEPGLVVFVDPQQLLADARVCHTKDPPTSRSGPFVCTSSGSGHSTWAPLTTEPRRERLLLEREWLSGGHRQWLRDDQYLNDGANTWTGPDDAFVTASHAELTGPSNRARVSATGMEAIQQEIHRQRRRQDRTC